MAKRYFTLEQAIAALAVIRPLVQKIQQIRQEIISRQPEVWSIVEKSLGNGGNRAGSQVALEFNRLEALVREIQTTGALVKDLNAGLVDFPTRRKGREVYLCWKFDEAEIRYWHDLDAGFAGRQLI